MRLANKVYKANVRKYEWESWARRYRHFKQQEKAKYRAIATIIEDFLARKSKGEPVDLIPFFNHSFLIQARSWMVDSKKVGR
jgi:hypothetical protein